MFTLFQNRRKQLQEQQDLIYGLIRSGKPAAELEEYFDIYLSLMGRYAGDLDTQLLIATVFARYAKTFATTETEHLSLDRAEEMRAAAKRMILGIRDNNRYSLND